MLRTYSTHIAALATSKRANRVSMRNRLATRPVRRPHRHATALGILAVLVAAQIVLIACGGTDSEGAPLRVFSVAEALEHRGNDVIRVRGSVVIDRRGTTR